MTADVSSRREATTQDPAALTLRRRRLLARLAEERGELLWRILGPDELTVTEKPIFDESDWTAKDLLAHIAAWDRWEHRAMDTMLTGEEPDFAAVQDVDSFNAAAVDAWRDRTLAEVLAELHSARTAWVAWLRDVPLQAFFRPRKLQNWDWAFPNCLEIQWQHDAEHAAQLAAWRERIELESRVGPKGVLVAALDAAREEFLAATGLVRAKERASRRVCGEWTLKDLLGHLADWERVGAEGLREMAAGRAPDVDPVADIDAWNRRHAEIRRGQPWQDVRADLDSARVRLLRPLKAISQEKLARSYPFPWGPEGTANEWVCAFISHDREHAEGLRESA
jgi:hypothetical protein